MFNKPTSNNRRSVTYSFDNKTLWLQSFDNKKEIKFEYPIRQVIQFKNRFLVRLEPDIGKLLNENIYCLGSNGELLWQVKPTQYIDADCPYTNIIISDSSLYAFNWSGEKVQIDLNSGDIIKKNFTK